LLSRKVSRNNNVTDITVLSRKIRVTTQ